VQAVFERLRANGDIYMGTYEGWYCVNDETFWLESRLVEGRCPDLPAERSSGLSEDAWFFRLSAYRAACSNIFARTRIGFVRAASIQRNDGDLEGGLEISRSLARNFSWGIQIPGGGSVVYVWFDALLKLHLGDRLDRQR